MNVKDSSAKDIKARLREIENLSKLPPLDIQLALGASDIEFKNLEKGSVSGVTEIVLNRLAYPVEQLIERLRTIRRQQKALATLERKGVSSKRTAYVMNVGNETVGAWRSGRKAAKPDRLRQLEDLARTPEANIPQPPLIGARGRISKATQKKREVRLRKVGLFEPQERAKRVLALLEKFGLPRQIFAELLGVSRSTLYRLLDPNSTEWMAETTAQTFLRLEKNGLPENHKTGRGTVNEVAKAA